MTKKEYEAALAEKKAELVRIEDDIKALKEEYALSAMRACGYDIGQRIEYRGKTYEVVGASMFVHPCPDGRLVLKNGTLGKDRYQLYGIQCKSE